MCTCPLTLRRFAIALSYSCHVCASCFALSHLCLFLYRCIRLSLFSILSRPSKQKTSLISLYSNRCTRYHSSGQVATSQPRIQLMPVVCVPSSHKHNTTTLLSMIDKHGQDFALMMSILRYNRYIKIQSECIYV